MNVSEIREICGDYAIDIKHGVLSKDALTLYFNSRRNAEMVKYIIEVDSSIPNVATVADVVEVVRCKDCKHSSFNKDSLVYRCDKRGYYTELVKPDGFCSEGERR